MKPATKSLLKWALVLMLVFAGYIVAVVRFRSQFAPEPHVRTFADLQRQGVPMTRAVRLPSGTGDVCVFGDVQPLLWTLPSGPPAYHFDASGQPKCLSLYSCPLSCPFMSPPSRWCRAGRRGGAGLMMYAGNDDSPVLTSFKTCFEAKKHR